MAEPRTCQEIRELLPELAAGVADGTVRASALAHLELCHDCRRELDETMAMIDGLILLAPDHEPAPGFESAVLTGMRPAVRSLPARVVAAAAVAAAAAALAGGLTGAAVWRHINEDRQLAEQYRNALAVADGRYFTAADIRTAVEPAVGHVFAYQGRPSWMFVTIDSAPTSGKFQVRLITTDRRTIAIGACHVTAGKGSWGGIIQMPIRTIESIQLARSDIPQMSAQLG